MKRQRGPAPAPTVQRPWLPTGLHKHGLNADTVQQLSYLVIDEIVGDAATISVSPWPIADERGRLRFLALDGRRDVGVPLARLRDELYRGLAKRQPRVGDVFAAAVPADARAILDRFDGGAWPHALSRLMPGPVYDLSAEARKVAKLAFYASVAPVLSKEAVRTWKLSPKAARSRKAAAVRQTLREADHG